jgi:hypothetical protein
LILLFSAAFVLTYQPKADDDYYYDQEKEREGEYTHPGSTDVEIARLNANFWGRLRKR